MRSRATVVAVCALTLVGTACASGGGAAAGATSGSGSIGSTGSSGGGGGYGRGDYGYGSTGATGSTGAMGGGAAADLTVTAINYRFDPVDITVSSGDVIEVRDTNPQTPHTFTVTGTEIDLAVDPQSSGTVTIDLDPGTYDVVCRFHGSTQGMTATLTVE